MRTSRATTGATATICSTVTIAPRRAASAPHARLRAAADASATFPCRRRRAHAGSPRPGATWRSSPTSPKGESTTANRRSFHRRAADRAGDDGREVARRRLEPLREGKEGPVLHLDLAPTRYARAKIGFGVKFGNVSPEYPVTTFSTSPPLEEQRSQAREAEHHEREPRVPPPPLAHDLAGGGRPAGVPDQEMRARPRDERARRRRPERQTSAGELSGPVSRAENVSGSRVRARRGRDRRCAGAASPGSRAARRSSSPACSKVRVAVPGEPDAAVDLDVLAGDEHCGLGHEPFAMARGARSGSDRQRRSVHAGEVRRRPAQLQPVQHVDDLVADGLELAIGWSNCTRALEYSVAISARLRTRRRARPRAPTAASSDDPPPDPWSGRRAGRRAPPGARRAR